MNKKIINVLMILLIFFCETAYARTIAFLRNDNEIWIYEEKDKKEQYICRGYDPRINPEGTYIAFTYKKETGSRYIAIVHIKGKSITLLESIPGNNNYGPQWSFNGDTLAFSFWGKPAHNFFWNIGIFSPFENAPFFILKKEGTDSLYSPTWSTQKDTVICHDMYNVYEIDMHGTITKKIPYAQLGGTDGISSATHFILSKNGEYLIFDAEVQEFIGLPEPSSGIHVYDVKTKSTRCITSAKICALNPYWYSDSSIVFEGFTQNDIKHREGTDRYKINRRIYRIDITGKNLKVLIENAREPSVSNR